MNKVITYHITIIWSYEHHLCKPVIIWNYSWHPNFWARV